MSISLQATSLQAAARVLLPAACLLGLTAFAGAQSLPTASRVADIQAGATFAFADTDYNPSYGSTYPAIHRKAYGFGFYADADITNHLGVEIDFHQVSNSDPILYERTYEIGPRYVRNYGRAAPYAKAMYGRGVFNFPGFLPNGQEVEAANLAYNIFTAGAGLDLHVRPSINIRVVDVEYQHWNSFPSKNLNPIVLSVGVAYHFHGDVKGLTH